MQVSTETYERLVFAANRLLEETRWECGSYIQELACDVRDIVAEIGSAAQPDGVGIDSDDIDAVLRHARGGK